MNSFVTQLGENKAPMIVVYAFEDNSDDLCKTELLVGGVDIYDALNPYWQQVIDSRCHRHAQELQRAEARERAESRAMDREYELAAWRSEFGARHGVCA